MMIADMLFKTEFLPYVFGHAKPLTAKQYYDALVTACPEYKDLWAQMMPGEQQVQDMIVSASQTTGIYGNLRTHANQIILDAQKTLGVHIDPEYKFPNHMTNAEYEKHIMYGMGLWYSYWNQPDAIKDSMASFDSKNPNSIDSITAMQTAYMIIWTQLHYDKSKIAMFLSTEWLKLCTLNPELKTIKLDMHNLDELYDALNGVASGFPAKDIDYFINNKDMNKRNTDFQVAMAKTALPKDFSFGWIPCPETIMDIDKKYRVKLALQQKTNSKTS